MSRYIVDDFQLPTPVTPPPQLGQFPAPQGSRVGTTCSLNQEAATAWAARTRLQRPESPTYYYWKALPHFHQIRRTLTEYYGWRDVTKPMEMVLYDVAFTLDPPDAQPLDCYGDCMTGVEHDIDCVHAMAGGFSLPTDFRTTLRDDEVGRRWESILRFPSDLLPAARSPELGLVVNTSCRPLLDAFYLLQCLYPGTFSLFESDDLGHERTYTMRGLPPVSWMEGRCRMVLCDIFGVEGFAELVCAAVDAERSIHRLVFPAVRQYSSQSKPQPKPVILTRSKTHRPPVYIHISSTNL